MTLTVAPGRALFALRSGALTRIDAGAEALPFVAEDTSAIDFASVTRDLGPMGATYVGTCSSTYGRRPSTNTDQAAAEQALDARFWRLPVRWNESTGRIVTSALGAGNFSIEPDIALYYGWGHRMVLVIAGQGGDFGTWTAGDASKIVQRLVTLGYDMARFDFSGPNEPGIDGSVAAADKTTQKIIDRNIVVVNEIRTVLPGRDLWGPVHFMYNRSDLQSHMTGMGERLAGTNYHHYAMGGNNDPQTTAWAFDHTKTYETEVAQIKADAAARGVSAEVNVDELNFSVKPDYNTPLPDGYVFNGEPTRREGRLFRAENTVWIASALGRILRAGGRGMPYATQNKSLGVMVQNEYDGDTSKLPEANGVQQPDSSPMPAYWGIAAWTGGGAPGGSRMASHMARRFYGVTTTQPVTGTPPPADVSLYTFDSTTNGWTGGVDCTIARSTAQKHDGASSLAITRANLPNATGQVIRADDANQNGSLTSTNGDTLKTWVLVPVGSPGTEWRARIEVQNASFQFQSGPEVALTPGAWAQISYTPSAALWANHKGIAVQFAVNNPATPTATVHIDTMVQSGAAGPPPVDESTEVFAVDNEAAGFNVLVINKRADAGRKVRLSLAGLPAGSWSYRTHRTNPGSPYARPTSSASTPVVGGGIDLDMARCSYTLVELAPLSAPPSDSSVFPSTFQETF